MLSTALLAMFVTFACYEMNYIAGDCKCDRAIVVGLVAGIAFGDITTGVIIGALLEVTFMGVVQVGGSATADPASSTVLAVVFVVVMGMDQSTAVALAVPVGVLGGIWWNFMMLSAASFAAPLITKAAESGDMMKMNVLMFGLGAVKYFISALPVFLCVLLGAEPMNELVNALPANVIAGLSASGSLLPAIGMGMLLKMLWDSKIAIYFFLGFIMVSYLGLSTVGVAVFGIVIVVLFVLNGLEKLDLEKKLNERPAASDDSTLNTDEEAFFA